MFHPVIAVDSAKKAMEFLGLKDGGGKVTTAEPPASLDAHFSFRDHGCPRVCACARDGGFCSPPLFWKQKVAAFHGGKSKRKPLPAVRLPATGSLTAASTKLPASGRG